MSVKHEMRRLATEMLGDDEDLAATLGRIYSRIVRESGDLEWRDVVMQFAERSEVDGHPDLIDVYWFVQANHLLQQGQLAIAWIPTEVAPAADLAPTNNQQVLRNSVQERSMVRYIEVTSGPGGSDGFIDVEATKGIFTRAAFDNPDQWIPIDLPAMRFPLEIGTTDPTMTMHRLTQEGRLARWAHGSKRLYLIANLEFGLVI